MFPGCLGTQRGGAIGREGKAIKGVNQAGLCCERWGLDPPEPLRECVGHTQSCPPGGLGAQGAYPPIARCSWGVNALELLTCLVCAKHGSVTIEYYQVAMKEGLDVFGDSRASRGGGARC